MRTIARAALLLVSLHASPALAASKEVQPPDPEMLRMMEFLREMEMIKQMEILQQMHQVEAVGDPAKGAPPQNLGKRRRRLSETGHQTVGFLCAARIALAVRHGLGPVNLARGIARSGR
jgi:hypothetical protein